MRLLNLPIQYITLNAEPIFIFTKKLKKTIPLVAFFKQRKGIWEPQSIHPILKEANQLKNISVNQYLEEKVKKPHESEVAEILKF